MLNTILNTLSMILDVSILWFAIYQLLKYSRNNFKLTLIFKGVIVIFLLKLASNLLNLYAVGTYLDYLISSIDF